MPESQNNNNVFYSCKTCLYKTKCIVLIKDHVEKRCIRNSYHQPFKCTESKPEEYACNKCFFEAELKTTLKRHSLPVHQNLPTETHLSSHNCRICNFQTFSLLLYLRHINHHDRENTRKAEMNENNLCTQNHENNYLFTCEKCSYKTKMKALLKQHQLLKHTSPDEINWFECERCAYKAKTAGSLKTHTIAKHTPANKIKWFECGQCSYKAKQSGVLRTHVLYKHTPSKDIKWYKCQWCCFETKQAGILKTHVLVRHKSADEVKWFECAHCPYKARQKSYLANHIQRKHCGDRLNRSNYKVERKTDLVLKFRKIN